MKGVMRCVALILGAVLVSPACAPPREARVVPRVLLAAIPCDSGANCALLEGGGVGCCVASADGSRHRWRCRRLQKIDKRAEPHPIVGLVGVVEVAPGGHHSCARIDDGTVWCWGFNKRGKLGIGSYPATGAITASIFYPGTEGVGLIEAGHNGSHSCARFGDGTVRCGPKGDRLEGPACRPIEKDSAVYMQCDETALLPTALCPEWRAPVPVVAAADAALLRSAGWGSCLLTSKGRVACWGDNGRGQVTGLRRTYPLPVPTTVQLPLPAVELGLGSSGGCAVLRDATVACWYTGNYKARKPTPPRRGGLSNVAQVDGDGGSGCARHLDGGVTCWGSPKLAQSTAAELKTHPTGPARHRRIVGLPRVSALAAAGHHACGISGGAVWCWGTNSDGQLGDGSTNDRPAPVKVVEVQDAVQIAVSTNHSCSLSRGGAVDCWGLLLRPSEGKPKWQNVLEPVRVLEAGATSIGAGGVSTCAVSDKGTVSCWGNVVIAADEVEHSSVVSARAARTPPKPPTLMPASLPPAPTCRKLTQYCCGAYCDVSEDKCLDRRAEHPDPANCSCTEKRLLHHVALQGTAKLDSLCLCELDETSCSSAGRGCANPKQILKDCADAEVEPAKPSKQRIRWCFDHTLRQCTGPPPRRGHPRREVCRDIPRIKCARSLAACRSAAKQHAGGKCRAVPRR